jgi:hypothetical protein
MHLISSTFHPPSVVVYSLACTFQNPDKRYLVVLRSDKLQIYVLEPHGTNLVCEKEIWGLPKGLIQLESSVSNVATPNYNPYLITPSPLQKHLVLSLDIPQARILILEFNAQTSELLVHHTSTISPLAHRPSVGFSGILGSAQSVCASFYNGHIKVLEVGSKAPYKVKESDLRFVFSTIMRQQTVDILGEQNARIDDPNHVLHDASFRCDSRHCVYGPKWLRVDYRPCSKHNGSFASASRQRTRHCT